MITKINTDLERLFVKMKKANIYLLASNTAVNYDRQIQQAFFELENIIERELVLNKQQFALIKTVSIFNIEDTYQPITGTVDLFCCTISVKSNNLTIEFQSSLPVRP